MGCIGSKIEDEEVVSRCKQRKRYAKRAVNSRNAFATAHANYVASLKTSGATFREFAEFEFREEELQRFFPEVSSTNLPSRPPDMEASSSSAVETARSASFSQMTYGNSAFSLNSVNVYPLPPMACQNTPFVSERVVLSPVKMMASQATRFGSETTHSSPQSPHEQRNWSGYSAYQEYLYNDAPPPDVYDNMRMPQSQPESIHFQQPPSPPLSMFNYGWDWLDLFRASPMSMHFPEPGRNKPEDLKRVLEEEDIPDLEAEGTLPHEIKGDQMKAEVEEANEEGLKDFNVENGKAKLDYKNLKKEYVEDPYEAEMTNLKPSELEPEEKFSKKGLDPIMTKLSRKSRNMREILTEIDVQFSKAFESGKNVSKVLEASKIHYTSNLADLLGLADHSSRFLSSVSWGYWSPRTPLSSTSSSSTSTSTSEDSTVEDFGLLENHASTFDKLYAWEKKLYKEVKALETANSVYERKRIRLQAIVARGEGDEKIEKARASNKALETELIVAGQALDETLSAIRNLTNDELYPQLIQLLEGSTAMWKEMSACHQHQTDAVSFMHVPEVHTLESTSNTQRLLTLQLQSTLDTLQSSFSAVIRTQKEYIRNLNMWLSVSLFRPERELDQTGASLSANATPRIYHLCEQWQQALDKLADKRVISSLKQFSELIRGIVRVQNDEHMIKKSLDSLTKDLSRKVQALHNAQKKHCDVVTVKQEKAATGEPGIKGPFEDRKEELKRLRIKVEKEQERYCQAIRESRSMTLCNLKEGLPELFKALSDFAAESAKTFHSLYSQAKNGKVAM